VYETMEHSNGAVVGAHPTEPPDHHGDAARVGGGAEEGRPIRFRPIVGLPCLRLEKHALDYRSRIRSVAPRATRTDLIPRLHGRKLGQGKPCASTAYRTN